jgi:hypothetical protein
MISGSPMIKVRWPDPVMSENSIALKTPALWTRMQRGVYTNVKRLF